MRRSALLLIACLALPATAGANLLTNAGFDSDLADWTVSATTASWDALDVAASGSSGSALLEGGGALTQCVALSGTHYTGGASVYIPSAQPALAQGLADVGVLFFAQAGCAGQPFNLFMGARLQPGMDAWAFLPIAGEIPVGAASASFRLEIENANGAFASHFDGASFDVLPEPRALLLLGTAALLPLRRGGRYKRLTAQITTS